MCINVPLFLCVFVLIFFILEFVIYLLYTRRASRGSKVSDYIIFGMLALITGLAIFLKENMVLLLLFPWFATGTTQIVFDVISPTRIFENKNNKGEDGYRLNTLWFGIKLGLYLIIFFLIVKNYRAGYIAIMIDYFISYVFMPYILRDSMNKIEYNTESVFLAHLLIFVWVLVFAVIMAYTLEYPGF